MHRRAGSSAMRLDGKVAVVVGAGGALGTAISLRFAQEGVRGLVLADLDQAAVEGTAEQVALEGCAVVASAVDVRDRSAVDQLVTSTVEELGAVDVMVNNAGLLAPNRRLHGLDDEDWRRSFEVNLMGVVHGMTSAVGAMRGRGGSIISTASVAGMTAWSHSAPYAATKAAVIQLTKVAAVEYASEGIRVNCVCPGSFPSAMLARLPDAAVAAMVARHPLGLGSAADLVGAYAYLASDDSRWTTGTAMVVDGGYSAP